MSDATDRDDDIDAVDAVVETKRRFSIIWIVPITAALIGGWLVYKAKIETGPTVTVTFSAAEGVVAGKTKVKFKDVEVGQVNSVALSEDLSKVVITATLDKTLENHLSESSRFWIVMPRFSGGTVTGLGTLLSGVYIGMEPGEKGKKQRRFVGLEDPPLVPPDTPGRHFFVKADSLGSLDVGSPIYYRQLKAGQVESFELDEAGYSVRLRIFINAPYDQYVHTGSRFWNASGITASLNAGGINVSTESLIALVFGGLAFDTPKWAEASSVADRGHMFRLFESREAANAPQYAVKEHLVMYFEDSVRGLTVGAPMELRGIKLGEVTDIELEGDARDLSFRIPVTVAYEPGRIKLHHVDPFDQSMQARKSRLQAMVDRGLRAQLKTGSLLTGQLFVNLEFFPNAPSAEVREENGVLVFPTIPSTLEELRTSISYLLEKLHKFPFEAIGNDLKSTLRGASELTNSEDIREALEHLNETMANSQELTAQLNRNTAPALKKTLDEAITTLTKLQQNVLEEDSAMYHELTRALAELTNAARSVRGFADYLERHPDALIKGK